MPTPTHAVPDPFGVACGPGEQRRARFGAKGPASLPTLQLTVYGALDKLPDFTFLCVFTFSHAETGSQSYHENQMHLYKAPRTVSGWWEAL